jgi:hypothetical protein
MALNRDEKDFLTQIGAAIVQSNKKYLEQIKLENELHVAQMKKISGQTEIIERLKRLERRTVWDGVVNLFRKKDA